MSKTPVRIMGVDPGTNLLGFALVEVYQKECKMLDIGTISLKRFPDHQTKLKEIYLQLQEIIESFLPSIMSIESPFYGKNVQSMLKLGRAQGVSIAAGITMGLEIHEYSPKKIKQSVTGNGNASKEQVAAMLETLLQCQLPDNQHDATDALGAAMCHYFQLGTPNGSGAKKYSGWKAFLKDNGNRMIGGQAV